jgi:hypothetical protein
MNLGQVYSTLYAKLGKDQYGGYISPNKFNDALYYVNLIMFNRYSDALEITSEISDDIYVFTKTLGDNEIPPLELNSYGYGQLPEDFIKQVRAHVYGYTNTSCTTSEKETYMVTIMSNDKFNGRIARRGTMLKPNRKYPIGTIQNSKLYVQPAGYTKCVFTYLRQPVTPVFGYTIVDDEPIYDPATSVELEWPEQVHDAFVDELVKYFAITFQSEFSLQTSNPDKP